MWPLVQPCNSPCCIGSCTCLRWSEVDRETGVSSRGEGSRPSQQEPRAYLHHSRNPSPFPTKILNLIGACCVDSSSLSLSLRSFFYATRVWLPRAYWQPLKHDAQMTDRGSPANTRAKTDHCLCTYGSNPLSLPFHSANRKQTILNKRDSFFVTLKCKEPLILTFGRDSRYESGISISDNAALLIAIAALCIWFVESRLCCNILLVSSLRPPGGTRGTGSHHLFS